MPCRAWDELPLREFLRAGVSSDPEACSEWREKNGRRFFFGAADRLRYQPLLAGFDGGDGGPRRDAERMAGGEFCFFEKTWHECGTPPDWFRDPFHGHRLDSREHWSRVDSFAHGDIKCIWELSRFGFAYTLARAYWRDGDERWPELFWNLVEDWRAKNPPNQGPQWMCGQETAFRVMAWSFALHAFEGCPASTPDREARLLQMLAASGDRIAGNIGYALSQQNNHGISEAVGLWTLGAVFPEFRRAAEWEARGRGLLERLGRELIYDDGGFSQHSANYHRVMLQDFTWALRLAELQERPFSEELKQRVGMAVNFLYQLQDEASGGVPCFGGNDGALVLPLSPCDYIDFRPALQAASFACRRERLYPAGAWDEESLWLMGVPGIAADQDQFPGRKSFAAEEAGYYSLRSEDSFAVMHCSRRFQHRPAHADLLHVDLWWKGVNIAADPGTYSYNAPAPWDHGFRNTRFHNTITVEGGDQMESAGRFLWLPWVEGRGFKRSDRAWCGEHDGYDRLPARMRHRRRVEWLGGDGWQVEDVLEGRRPFLARLHWLLQDAPHEWDPEEGRLHLNLSVGGYEVQVEAHPAGAHATLVRASAESAEGWRSRWYQHREPALSLALEAKGSAVRFVTRFGKNR